MSGAHADEDTGPLKHPNPPLPAEPGRFRQVTDVAWDVAGNTYISDGYLARRESRSRRQLDQVLGRPRHRAGAVSYSA